MAIAYANNKNSASSGSASSVAVTFPNSTVSGNMILVSGGAYRSAGGPTFSASDNKGNTYTARQQRTFGTNFAVGALSAHNITGGASHQVTLSASNPSYLCIGISEFSGLDTTAPYDVGAQADGYGTAPSSGNTATTAQANELLFGVTYNGNISSGITPGTNYTELNDVTNPDTEELEDEYRIVSSTGAYAATSTCAAGTWGCVIATFKEASGGGGGAAKHFLTSLGAGK